MAPSEETKHPAGNISLEGDVSQGKGRKDVIIEEQQWAETHTRQAGCTGISPDCETKQESVTVDQLCAELNMGCEYPVIENSQKGTSESEIQIARLLCTNRSQHLAMLGCGSIGARRIGNGLLSSAGM